MQYDMVMTTRRNGMEVRSLLKVLAVLCITLACAGCDLNIDKVTPPSWIQGTWEGSSNVFTFTKNDIMHTKLGPSEGFAATDDDVTLIDATYSVSTYQIELKKNGVTEAHKFVLFSTSPDTLEYYHADPTGVFPSTATDSLDREL